MNRLWRTCSYSRPVLQEAFRDGAAEMLRLVCLDLSDYRDADEQVALILKRLEAELKQGEKIP